MSDPIPSSTSDRRLETHTCPTCGHEWRHGQHGGHNCADLLKDRLAAQAEEIKRLREREEWWDARNAAVCRALMAAGCPDCEPYPDDGTTDPWELSLRAGGRMIPVEERVRRLAMKRDQAEARVAELSALIRSIYAQDVEEDQQSPVEDLLRHQAGEYGRARCRVRDLERELAATVKAKQENDERFMIERDEARARVAELERELAGLAEGWDVEAERTEPSTEYADRIDALRECAAALRAALAK